MGTVKLYHPKLDRWHEFAESAVSQMEKAGWRHDKPARRQPAVSDQTPAATGGEEAATQPRRRRNHEES
ncbi:hypothetical protein BAY59_10755 [Prauserella coralliicola]|nr:hypothetical protein BAY59_10755 [Prauserella coralliicola]